MIEDAEAAPSGGTITTDLCIVGAGAAGISLALQFVEVGRDVLLIEAGGEKFDTATQALYEGKVVDPELHSPADRYRQRMFGGTTTTWGGRCIPFDPIDFEARSYAPHSGWPIDHAAVARYYPAANALCEAGDFDYSAATAVAGGMRPMIAGYEPTAFSTDPIERFSCPTDFGRRYRHRLEISAGVRVLLNASCTEIMTDATGGTVESLRLRTLSGKQFDVRANRVVLATGGLEAARLLLASRARHPNGIGNDRDLVGRYYMCHIAGTIGRLRFNIPRDRVWHGYDRAWDGIYCRRRLALRPESQRALGVGNIVLRLHHPRLVDPSHGTGILSAIYLGKPFISYEYAKRLYGPHDESLAIYLRHVLNVAREPFKTAAFMIDFARKRRFAERKFPSLIVASRSNDYSLDIHSEQLPNPDSRITLDTALDRFGMPRIAIDWRYTKWDIETVAKALATFQGELRQWGGASLDFDPDEVESCMLREGAFGGHHIGTTRMAASPTDGVVDSDCRVFGIDNLYIASSAVFPTSSQANPTLTIVALALRLADHLKNPVIAAGSGKTEASAATV